MELGDAQLGVQEGHGGVALLGGMMKVEWEGALGCVLRSRRGMHSVDAQLPAGRPGMRWQRRRSWAGER